MLAIRSVSDNAWLRAMFNVVVSPFSTQSPWFFIGGTPFLLVGYVLEAMSL